MQHINKKIDQDKKNPRFLSLGFNYIYYDLIDIFYYFNKKIPYISKCLANRINIGKTPIKIKIRKHTNSIFNMVS